MTPDDINQGRLELYNKAHQLAFSHYIRWGYMPAAATKVMEETSSMAALIEALAKFNPYHVPAGSPDGGQFTSGPGAGSSEADDAKPTVVAQLEEDEPREDLSETENNALRSEYESARDTLRQLDPTNRELESISGPDWTPSRSDIDRLNEQIQNESAKRVTNFFMPQGQLLGIQGAGRDIRILSGDVNDARRDFEYLTIGATAAKNSSYKGIGILLPGNAGFIGLRSSSDGLPTIDIETETLSISRVHYK